jgi:hypothetical protein
MPFLAYNVCAAETLTLSRVTFILSRVCMLLLSCPEASLRLTPPAQRLLEPGRAKPTTDKKSLGIAQAVSPHTSRLPALLPIRLW